MPIGVKLSQPDSFHAAALGYPIKILIQPITSTTSSSDSVYWNAKTTRLITHLTSRKSGHSCSSSPWGWCPSARQQAIPPVGIFGSPTSAVDSYIKHRPLRG